MLRAVISSSRAVVRGPLRPASHAQWQSVRAFGGAMVRSSSQHHQILHN